MRKKFVLLLAATMALCGTAGVISACSKEPEPESQVFKPGDTIIDEKEGEFTYDGEGNLVYEKYTAKRISIEYLVSESAYVTLSGQKPTELVIDGYKGDIKDLSVSEIENNIVIDNAFVSVVGVADGAFYGCETLETVDLSKTNTSLTFSVGTAAFANCASLKSVTIPENIYTNSAEIGSSAFRNDISLTSVTLGDKLAEIGSSAFYNCSSLVSVTIPKNVTKIQAYTFAYCDSLRDISVDTGATLKSIQNYAFSNTSISSLNLGSLTDLRYIGSNAFESTKLSNVNLPDSVTYIGSAAFYNCENLSSVTVPFLGNSIAQSATFNSIFGVSGQDTRAINVTAKTALSIPANSFSELKNINSLAINSFAAPGAYNVYESDGVSFTRYNLSEFESESYTQKYIDKSIGRAAFSGCTSLTLVALPDDTKVIGDRAFYGCESLNNFTLPTSVETIGEYAFSGCANLGTVKLSSNLQTISEYAFKDCTAINSITIPASVTTIQNNVFNGCENLYSLTIAKLNGVYPVYSDYNVLQSYEYADISNVSSWFGSNAPVTSITVDSLYTLPSYTFAGLNSLNSVNLTFKDIDESVFTKNFDRPYDIPAKSSIGSYAFRECISLAVVNITDNDGIISSIDAYAFSNCANLNEFTVPASVKTIGASAFAQCTGLSSFDVPASVYSVGAGALTGCNNLASLTIGAYNQLVKDESGNPLADSSYTYKTIGSLSALFGTGNTVVPSTLKTVTLKNVNYLYDNCFNGWENLQTVNLTFAGTMYEGSGQSASPNYTQIGASAFEGCKNLTTINLTGAENVKFIGESAFKNVAKLNSATFEKFNNVVSIGTGAFEGCSAITVITLPGTLTSIGTGVFKNCPNVTTLNIGNLADLNLSWVATLFGSSGLMDYNNNVSTQKYVAVTYKATASSTTQSYNVPVSLKTITVNGIDSMSQLGSIFFYNMSQIEVVALNLKVEENYVMWSNYNCFSGCSSLVSVFLPNTVKNVYLGTGVSANSIGYALGNAEVYEYAVTLSSYGNFWKYDNEKPVINDNYLSTTYTLNIGEGAWVEEDTENVIAIENAPLTVADIPESEYEGYVLVGWYTNSNYTGKAVSFPYYNSVNTTLYAKWVEEDALINIAKNGFTTVSSNADQTNGTVKSSGTYAEFRLTVVQSATVNLTFNLNSLAGTLVIYKGNNVLFTIDNEYTTNRTKGLDYYYYTTENVTLNVNLDEGEYVKVEFRSNYDMISYYANVTYTVTDRVAPVKPTAPVFPTVNMPSYDISEIVDVKGTQISESKFEEVLSSFLNIDQLEGFKAELNIANGYHLSADYDLNNMYVKADMTDNGVTSTYYYTQKGMSTNVYFKFTAEQMNMLIESAPALALYRNSWFYFTDTSGDYAIIPDYNNNVGDIAVEQTDYNYDSATGTYWATATYSGGYKAVVALTVDSSNNAYVTLALYKYNELYLSIQYSDFNDVTVTLPAELSEAVSLNSLMGQG